MAASITLSNLESARFFFAIVLLLVFAHSFGYLFQKFKLPRVIGEISAGWWFKSILSKGLKLLS